MEKPTEREEKIAKGKRFRSAADLGFEQAYTETPTVTGLTASDVAAQIEKAKIGPTYRARAKGFLALCAPIALSMPTALVLPLADYLHVSVWEPLIMSLWLVIFSLVWLALMSATDFIGSGWISFFKSFLLIRYGHKK